MLSSTRERTEEVDLYRVPHSVQRMEEEWKEGEEDAEDEYEDYFDDDEIEASLATAARNPPTLPVITSKSQTVEPKATKTNPASTAPAASITSLPSIKERHKPQRTVIQASSNSGLPAVNSTGPILPKVAASSTKTGSAPQSQSKPPVQTQARDIVLPPMASTLQANSTASAAALQQPPEVRLCTQTCFKIRRSHDLSHSGAEESIQIHANAGQVIMVCDSARALSAVVVLDFTAARCSLEISLCQRKMVGFSSRHNLICTLQSVYRVGCGKIAFPNFSARSPPPTLLALAAKFTALSSI